MQPDVLTDSFSTGDKQKREQFCLPPERLKRSLVGGGLTLPVMPNR